MGIHIIYGILVLKKRCHFKDVAKERSCCIRFYSLDMNEQIKRGRKTRNTSHTLILNNWIPWNKNAAIATKYSDGPVARVKHEPSVQRRASLSLGNFRKVLQLYGTLLVLLLVSYELTLYLILWIRQCSYLCHMRLLTLCYERNMTKKRVDPSRKWHTK